MLLLLVHDDHAQIGHGGEYGRAGAYGDGGFPVTDAAVGVQSLSCGQPRMDNGHLPTVAAVEDVEHLGGEADLGE